MNKMKKKVLFMSFLVGFTTYSNAQEAIKDTINLSEVSVVDFYRDKATSNSKLTKDFIKNINVGQEPSFILNSLPSIYSYSDTGNEFGYSYFRVRGIDQTRVNMTLDGMPLNDGEDMGVYFSNYPDLFTSLHSVEVNRGANISNNGAAGYAGSINFESVDLEQDTISSFYLGAGSYNTYKASLEYNMGRKNNFGFHMKLNQQESDGFRDNAFNNSQSAFVKLGYWLNNNHYFDILSFVGKSRNGQSWIGSSKEEINDDKNHNGNTEIEKDDFVQNITKLSYKGVVKDDLILTGSVYYNYLKGWYNFDNTLIGEEGVSDYNLQHHMVGGNFAIKKYTQFIDLIAGANAYKFQRDHNGYDGFHYDNTGSKIENSYFLKPKLKLGKFNLVGNIQYRNVNFVYVDRSNLNVPFEAIQWRFLNWSTSADFNINKSNYIYVSATKTHREPTRTDMFGGLEYLTEEINNTQSESVIDYELGYKLKTRNFKWDINGFFMDFKNELILNGEYGTNSLPIRKNVAKSYRGGIESTINYKPIKTLSIVNNTTFSKNKVKDNGYKMNHVMSPDWIMSQDIIYQPNKFKIGANIKVRSKMYIDLANINSLDASAKLNLYGSYQFKKFEVGALVNNVTNNKKYTNGMLFGDEVLYFVEAPTNVMFNIKWNL